MSENRRTHQAGIGSSVPRRTFVGSFLRGAIGGIGVFSFARSAAADCYTNSCSTGSSNSCNASHPANDCYNYNNCSDSSPTQPVNTCKNGTYNQCKVDTSKNICTGDSGNTCTEVSANICNVSSPTVGGHNECRYGSNTCYNSGTANTCITAGNQVTPANICIQTFANSCHLGADNNCGKSGITEPSNQCGDNVTGNANK